MTKVYISPPITRRIQTTERQRQKPQQAHADVVTVRVVRVYVWNPDLRYFATKTSQTSCTDNDRGAASPT